MTDFESARAPDGLRIYAVGDVHGCIDLLTRCHAAIAADLEARPPQDWRIVHVGDYVDRGPDSRGVIELLIGRQEADARHVCLLGNHDAMFADVLSGANPDPRLWLSNGGGATLESYGMDRAALIDAFERQKLREAALELVPEAHLAFLAGLRPMEVLGDYAFVHAGIEPGVPLDAQPLQSLIWIRGPFLNHEGDLGKVVVHGHTITPDGVEVRRNRIGIDTGSFATGRLSCIVLEEGDKHLLTGRGRKPLRED